MGLFVTLEGPEGSGKTTQLRQLADYMQERRYPYLVTREPGGTAIGEQIRKVILSKQNHAIADAAEALLFSAARAQIVAELVRPALEAGKIVVADRYADSTLAYQGYGLGLDLEALQAITRFATGGLVPDLTFYIDVPVQDGIARKQKAEVNRLDEKEIAYHERVRAGYRAMARAEPQRWYVIEGRHSVGEIQQEIRERLEDEIRRRGLHPLP